MKQLLAAGALICATAVTAGAAERQQRINDWIGKVAPPYPSGHTELAGSCIADSKPEADPCDASIVVLRDEQSKLRFLLVLRKLHAMNDKPLGGKVPMNLVTDALEADALDDATSEVATSLCQRNGRDDRAIIAVVPTQRDAEWFTHLSAAWWVDANGRFQSIPANEVRCRNEGFGHDG